MHTFGPLSPATDLRQARSLVRGDRDKKTPPLAGWRSAEANPKKNSVRSSEPERVVLRIRPATRVRVGSRIRPAILQVAAVSVLDEVDRHADGGAAIGQGIIELVDGLRLVEAGEAQVVVRSIHRDVLIDVFGERVHSASKYFLPPTSRRYLVEKFVCIPEPFQSSGWL